MLISELSIFQLFSIGLFGFLFGIFETSTNLLYLVSKNYDLPRKQHSKELPDNPTDTMVRHKVIQMLGLGLVLLSTAIISISIVPQIFIVGIAAIFLSGLIDYGKFQRKDMLIVWMVISIIASIFVLI